MILGVPTIRRYDLLGRLIASVLAGSRVPDAILIVDNGGNYESKENCVRVIYRGPNLGVAASWNRLLQAGAWIISNDDIVFARHTFEELANALESGQVIVNELGWALFGQRPEVAEKIGFYDERFFPAYYEDADYHARLLQAGIPTHAPVLSEPVEHVQWASAESTEAVNAICNQNFQRFVDKWGGPPEEILARLTKPNADNDE
jgi:GT2 family glycosyltransferase